MSTQTETTDAPRLLALSNIRLRASSIQHRNTMMVLLCGGDKTTQKRDIAKAKLLVQDWKVRS